MTERYVHQSIDNATLSYPVGKVVCIGQNYHDHIVEMGSVERPEALFFIKPSTALVPLSPSFSVPADRGECHNELELAILIGEPLSKAQPEDVLPSIAGVGLALDLTLREVQAKLKSQGRPWELAKGFDGACPVSPWLPTAAFADLQNLNLQLVVNGQVRQDGNTQDMIRPVATLIAEMSQHFTLLPGDIVITGTPAGVGPLKSGDSLELRLFDADNQYAFVTQVN